MAIRHEWARLAQRQEVLMALSGPQLPSMVLPSFFLTKVEICSLQVN